MKIDLSKYALDRYREKQQAKEPGPVVTLSRQYGCPSKPIAQALTQSINNYIEAKGKGKAWNWVNKELLEESARELKLDPTQLKYVFNYEERGFFDEILASQGTRYYASDKRIRKTIGRVIHSIAEDGNVVIVGRAGAALTRDIRKSLHIRLMASLPWRTERIMKMYDLGREQALRKIRETDRKRKKWMDYYYGRESDDSLFDLVYNCESLPEDMIVESILTTMIMRRLI